MFHKANRNLIACTARLNCNSIRSKTLLKSVFLAERHRGKARNVAVRLTIEVVALGTILYTLDEQNVERLDEQRLGIQGPAPKAETLDLTQVL